MTNALLTGNDFTLLSLASPIDVSVGVADGRLALMNNTGTMLYGEALYTPSAMRWWRLRRNGSADGTSWTTFGAPVPRSATEAAFSVFAGLSTQSNVARDTAIYRRLVVCP